MAARARAIQSFNINIPPKPIPIYPPRHPRRLNLTRKYQLDRNLASRIRIQARPGARPRRARMPQSARRSGRAIRRTRDPDTRIRDLLVAHCEFNVTRRVHTYHVRGVARVALRPLPSPIALPTTIIQLAAANELRLALLAYIRHRMHRARCTRYCSRSAVAQQSRRARGCVCGLGYGIGSVVCGVGDVGCACLSYVDVGFRIFGHRLFFVRYSDYIA